MSASPSPSGRGAKYTWQSVMSSTNACLHHGGVCFLQIMHDMACRQAERLLPGMISCLLEAVAARWAAHVAGADKAARAVAEVAWCNLLPFQ